MRSVAPITKIVPLFLWSAKMPKNYAKCQKFMQKLWNFIFCHLNIVRAVYKLSFKLLVRSVAQITKIVPPFLWFRGGLCYKHRRIRHGFKNWCKITSRKKSSLTSALVLASLGVKLPFLSKKCIFRAENDIFSKSSFYTKMFSDPKYSFSVCQK